MNEKQLKKTSKFLSLVLRHRPELIGLDMDTAGWVDTRELLEKSKRKGYNLDFDTLEQVVANNNKKRFSFNDDQSRIRANQGHSVKIELGYEAVEPPEFLFHGTATRFIDSIQKQGLLKRNRHHVHLSAEEETARSVGGRHGKPVILVVQSRKMHQEGLPFFRSKNGVWLTEHVPPEFIDA